MSGSEFIYAIRWLIRDTFRQAMATRIFWVLLAVSGLCIVFCLGGSVEIVHRVRSQVLRAYLGAWRWIGFKLGMAQGAAQFCRAPAFRILNGYDESQFMGEDVDFYWRLRKLCARSRGHVEFLSDVKVIPSPRRFDTAPVWRTLIWMNPAFIWAFRKVRSVWAAWYVAPPR